MNSLRVWGRRLLACAARLTPEVHRSWSDAMLGEFEAIDSDVEAFWWSLGSAFTLMRVSLAATVRAELERGLTMSRVFMVVSVLLLVVLWLATPVVRHGVLLVGESWSAGLYAPLDAATNRDVRKVRADQTSQTDPEALAYLALNESDSSNADSLITKAVQRDPRLGWGYALLAKAHTKDPITKVWIQKSREYDGNNGLIPLLAARETRLQAQGMPLGKGVAQEWEAQMQRAFAAPEYNDYMRERMDLQRTIMRRYGVGSPISLLAVIYRIHLFEDIHLYADKLVLEANRTGDLSKYREVISFAQRLYLGASTDLEQNMAKNLLERSMGILSPKLQAQGRNDEAAQMAFQVAAIRKDTKSSIESRNDYLLNRTASVIHVATLFSLISALGLACGVVAWAVARFRKTSVRAAFATMIGSVTMLTSSLAVLYVSYRPYEQMYSWFVNGGYVTPKVLASFGSIANVPFTWSRTSASISAQVLLWEVVFVAGLVVLVWIALRHLSMWRRSEVR